MIKIQDSKEKVMEQEIWYDWKPIFCQKCLQIRHSCVKKVRGQVPKREQMQEPKKQWKPTTQEGNAQPKRNLIIEGQNKEVDGGTTKQNEKVKDEWQVVKRKGTRPESVHIHTPGKVAEEEQYSNKSEVGEQSGEAGRDTVLENR